MEWKAHKNIIIITKFETEITGNKTIFRFSPEVYYDHRRSRADFNLAAVPTAYFEPISDSEPDASVKIVKFMWRDAECNLNQFFFSKNGKGSLPG